MVPRPGLPCERSMSEFLVAGERWRAPRSRLANCGSQGSTRTSHFASARSTRTSRPKMPHIDATLTQRRQEPVGDMGLARGDRRPIEAGRGRASRHPAIATGMARSARSLVVRALMRPHWFFSASLFATALSAASVVYADEEGTDAGPPPATEPVAGVTITGKVTD